MTKLDDLVNWFEDKNKVIIALSGGVDSALVAYAAFQKLGNLARECNLKWCRFKRINLLRYSATFSRSRIIRSFLQLKCRKLKVKMALLHPVEKEATRQMRNSTRI